MRVVTGQATEASAGFLIAPAQLHGEVVLEQVRGGILTKVKK